MIQETEDTTVLRTFPSIDKPWFRYYNSDVIKESEKIPQHETIFDFLEKRLTKHGDTVPAIHYYGRIIKRSEFLDKSYEWANALQHVGIRENDIVSVYGPWFPEIAYIFMALNMLGAVPYFLKLSIGKNALIEETIESRFAIVYDGMWENVKEVFSTSQFEKVIFVSPVESMPPILKLLAKSKLKQPNVMKLVKQNGSKYMYSADFFKRYYAGSGKEVKKAESDGNRVAFITSSSGTTSKNTVKGIMASNRAVICSILFEDAPGLQYDAMNEGEKCLCNFPPTAATSVNCLFILPLAMNMQVIIEPRLDENKFYDQIIKYKPNYTIATGAFWETFFRRIESDIHKGKKTNLDFADLWIIGGEGTLKADYDWMNKILDLCQSTKHITSGYGMSECCATVSLDYLNIGGIRTEFEEGCVGIPYPTMIAGCFDENGEEVGYRKPGELWVKSPAAMVGYYRKDKLTEKCLKNGWVHTGDIFEINENGELLFRGRKDDCVKHNDEVVYLFNVAARIREDKNVKYAIVNQMDKHDDQIRLAAHIILMDDTANNTEIAIILKRLQETMEIYLPQWIDIAGYKIHHTTFKSSPTTAKKDRLYYAAQKDGYIRINKDGAIENISF